MIANIEEFERKLIDSQLSRKQLAEKICISPSVLTAKLEEAEGEFKLSEMIEIAQITKMDDREFLFIFFGEKLSLNEINEKKVVTA